MLDQFTPRQQRLIERATALAEQFAPRADQYDRSGAFPFENHRDLIGSGYTRLTVPSEFGGEGGSLFDLVLSQDHLARGCGATAMAIDMHLHLLGRLAQQRPWPAPAFEQLCRAVVEQGALINSAATEPELGSPSRGGLFSTQAVRVPGGYRLTGRKSFVSLGPALQYVLVSATLPPAEDAPQGHFGRFLLPMQSAGVQLEPTWNDALSLRASGSHDLLLDQVFVPETALVERSIVGAPSEIGGWNAWFQLSVAATYLGVGQGALDAVAVYARQRVPTALGKPIAELPDIQRRAGQAGTTLLAARTLLYTTAQQWDAAERSRREALMPQVGVAKVLATNAAIEASDQAMRIAGGAGITRALPLERYFRDARAGLVHPPNDDAAYQAYGRMLFQR